MAIKLDIVKDFDTIEWNFLIKTLQIFGFNEVFIRCIKIILESARLSIWANGSPHGYFECGGGVRQDYLPSYSVLQKKFSVEASLSRGKKVI